MNWAAVLAPFVPAKAGTQSFWIPAFAGMNGDWCCHPAQMLIAR
jgi:hypothetical protein